MTNFGHKKIFLCLLFFFISQKKIFAQPIKRRTFTQTKKVSQQRKTPTTDVLWNVCDKVILDQKIFDRVVLNAHVPSVIHVADIKIVLTNRARHRVKKEIIKYFSSKTSLERLLSLGHLHLPVVEKIFRNYKFPLDLKYVMILESSCVGNAKSNARDPAIGYWQFKSQAAKYAGLKINNTIDERMNLVSSTHGFMRYIHNVNRKLNNYVLAVTAFYLGPKGADDMIKKLNIKNSKVIKLDHTWHFYIYMFLGYKLIFSKLLPAIPHSKVRLCGAKNCNGMTIDQVCRKYKMNKDIFLILNRWLKTNRIPKDNKNTVIILAR